MVSTAPYQLWFRSVDIVSYSLTSHSALRVRLRYVYSPSHILAVTGGSKGPAYMSPNV